MNKLRIILSVICIGFGLVTILGYFLVINPRYGAPITDIILAFAFALLFIIGGVLVLSGKYYGINYIFVACLLYLIAGLYNPIMVHGITGLGKIHTQFYASLLFRLAVSFALYYTIYKLKMSDVSKNT